MYKKYKKSGFTLIEVLIVMGLLAILAGVVIVAINPGRQFGQARNNQRRSDVNAILNAIYQYAAENTGTMPPTVTALTAGTPTEACRTGAASCVGLVNVSADLVGTDQRYLIQVPVDPSETNANEAGYRVTRNTNNRITVDAPLAESATISVTR